MKNINFFGETSGNWPNDLLETNVFNINTIINIIDTITETITDNDCLQRYDKLILLQ